MRKQSGNTILRRRRFENELRPAVLLCDRVIVADHDRTVRIPLCQPHAKHDEVRCIRQAHCSCSDEQRPK
jgi:hypothetical protein